MIQLLVTRHAGLVTYLQEIGLADERTTTVIDHATVDDVQGLHVCGVLPHSLSCECKTFTEIPLDLPKELRGQELTLEQVRQYAGPVVTYRVRRIVRRAYCYCGGTCWGRPAETPNPEGCGQAYIWKDELLPFPFKARPGLIQGK